jgi:hypothetical protein
VYAIAVTDTFVYVGGNFTVAGGRPSYMLARWYKILPPADVHAERPMVGEDQYNLRVQPNPVASQSSIGFTLPEPSQVRLLIYDSRGEIIRTLVDMRMDVGSHRIQIATKDLSTGIYFCRLQVAGLQRSTQVMVVR